MRAIDTNILVYAHRADSRFHQAASTLVRSLAEGRAQWAIPWPCIYEFYSVVTHPRIYSPPTSADQALDQIRAWIDSPSCVPLAEPSQHWPLLETTIQDAQLAGPVVHDAQIAALCIAQGVTELVTQDRDFSRFPALRCAALR